MTPDNPGCGTVYKQVVRYQTFDEEEDALSFINNKGVVTNEINLFGTNNRAFKFLELYKMEAVPLEHNIIGYEDYEEMQPVKRTRALKKWEIKKF